MARELFDDARTLLDRIVAEKLLTANGVYGFFPANSDGDDIVVYTDESRTTERARFPMLRQQWEREGQTSFRSLADYIAPVDSGRGRLPGRVRRHGRASASRRWSPSSRRDHDDYNAIMAKALADRLAEAFAEIPPRARPPRLGLRPRRAALEATT